jgi:LysM repeat protein
MIALLVLVGIGAGGFFLASRGGAAIASRTTPTATQGATATLAMTATPSPSPTTPPTPTLEPPIDYTVKAGDVCSTIAYKYGVSVESIAQLNNLPADCGLLTPGQKLQVPHPTPTPPPAPTATLNSAQATENACGVDPYVVKEGDTLGSIAANYAISTQALRDYNGLPSDTVIVGTVLKVPLCMREPTPGPTPTPTSPPPYAAPNLLLPQDGQTFDASYESITLQWASVATLRSNESYAVTIQDLTSGTHLKKTEYTTDNKLILSSDLRPNDGQPHAFQWVVFTVRQVGSTADGQPVWEVAGANSQARVFVWTGGSAPASSPTPSTAP